jgi:hypothetical protein
VWRARIAVNGKQRTLGSFDNKESAQAAYLAAKKELHPFGEIAKEVFAIPPKPRAKRDRSVSGFTGVYFRPNGKSWYAEITFERKKYRLGTFYSAEQAHEVFQAAKRKLQAGETL